MTAVQPVRSWGARTTNSWAAPEYHLAATLTSGQSFRWRSLGTGESAAWEGVVSGKWVRLWQAGEKLHAELAVPVSDWRWLQDYLQVHVDLRSVTCHWPEDEPMRAAASACRGLRLLRQEPWECLASFILSSTKQIVQIEQIVARLCERFGEATPVPEGSPPAFAFPSAQRLAQVSEAELRACRMGFRAPYLRETARRILRGEFDLERVRTLRLDEARAVLMELPGVGPKIADCVLLFAYGFQEAFPVDVWVMKVLRELYFPGKRINAARLRHFAATYFGPFGGYAQQYLFHYARRGAREGYRDYPRPGKQIARRAQIQSV